MGVPSFYRWLLEKYPLIVQQVIEDEPLEINGVKIPVDTTKPNPNNIEYDNLYLDMNGIIHPCFHPEDRAAPTTFGEVFKRMFDYIDRLFVMVRPRKLLYLAIDGVAPRAKMNQQRSRRFRAAKDAAEAAAEEERLRQEFEREGRRLPAKVDSQVFDSNVITPGTQFMSTLSFALQYYIHIKLNSDPGWKKIKVILSDANVPGEGEHKIMSYIRLQRNHPGYNPNTRHCLYGLDADLIMLALATHEVHMSILREVVFIPGDRDKCFLCGEIGHRAAECDGKIKRKAGELLDNADTDLAVKKPYQFVNCWILREYLEHDLQIPNSQLQRRLDRIIDDFIFICFFVGNDFLPHMPTLEIREGAIELMMSVYKKEFGSTTIYLTDRSKLNLRYVEQFIQAVALFEDNIFKRRAQIHQRQLERFNRDKAQASRRNESGKVVQPDSLVELSESLHSSSPRKLIRLSLDDKTGVANVQTKNSLEAEEIENREELKFKLNKLQREKNDAFGSENGEEDKVRLELPGWKERYYMEKFGAKSEEETEHIRRDVVLKYTEGLCWIMHYYYHGVCSWKWFYPYHYAPFASDLKLLDKLDIKFELGSPFKPFNQLLAVLPSASAHALPECFRTLMTDPNSPIIDFYPPDPAVDMNGKRYSWQGIMKLPFIKEQRLLDAVAKVEHSLTTEEIQRNSAKFDILSVAASHRLAKQIRSLSSHTNTSSGKEQTIVWKKVGHKQSEGMNGYLASSYGDCQPRTFSSPIEGMEDVLNNQVICAIYKVPDDCRGSDIAYPAPGVVFPKKTVHQVDMKAGGIWHEDGETRRKPINIIKIKRYNPQGSISGLRLAEVAHKLVVHTLNSKSKDINSAATLCLNTSTQNQQPLKTELPSKEILQEKVSPENKIVKMTKNMRARRNKKARFEREREKMMLVNGLVIVKETRAMRKKKAKIAREKELMLVNGLVGHTTNPDSVNISSAEASCPNTIIQNQQLLTSSEGEKMLVHELVVPTTNAKSEDINSATALSSNTIIQNELLKKDSPPQDNLQQDIISPECIIVEKANKKRKKTNAEKREIWFAKRLQEHYAQLAINAKSDDISSATALSPNTVIQNELVKKVPSQEISPENMIAEETKEKSRRKKKAKTTSEGDKKTLVPGLAADTVNAITEDINSVLVANTVNATTKDINSGLAASTVNATTEDINSAATMCPNTIIQNQPLLKNDQPSQDNLKEIRSESIIAKKRKRKTKAERNEMGLANVFQAHTINANSEDINSATALCSNAIIQNELLKKDSPPQDNLQHSPECIIVEKANKKKSQRKEIRLANKVRGYYDRISLAATQNIIVKKTKSMRKNIARLAKITKEKEKMMLVNGLVGHTTNQISEHISSAEASSCPNTIIQNSNEGEKMLIQELVMPTTNVKSELINSEATLCPREGENTMLVEEIKSQS